ncbi:hypothetical protein fHeYen901_258 [Yersinia phage fHe-Yen9-01]|uniref:Uncharacterized protein n=1 Tax=Yersinia phage fHe-Yen9-01 TaxID=1965363 RepID=A0A1V0DY04_9CAUD|nr:hypothetical protein KNT60_gp257 [Yersinia phage fHe-Yen9-01]ARB06031.1 hypothetical protein fHeYen901_258 [Yersinia phage fHe-Yen9-01]
MKRKTIELKEFEYKTQYMLNILYKHPKYSDWVVIEDKHGDIHKAKLYKFDDKFIFLRAIDMIGDKGINPYDVEFIEDKGFV